MTKTTLLALVTVMGFSMAGCASAQQTDSPGSRPADGSSAAEASQITPAASLAAALNAMNNGSAEVSGDTVTLSHGINAQKDLTVPAGVTLDIAITGDGGLGLMDGVTLTVNGTVNAPPNKIFVSGNAHSAAINGNGTIYLKSKGTLLIIGNGNKLTLDGVTLVGLPDNNNVLAGLYGGSEFVMKSGKITGNSNTNGSGGGVQVGGGTFTMEGGEISGNSAGNRLGGGGGGGVQVNGGGTFNMTDGTISGNIATAGNDGVSLGGGVLVVSGGIFNMEGGTISGNTAAAPSSYGGGVRVQDSTFTMKGGTIYGSNEGNNSNNANRGAALYVHRDTPSTVKWGTGGTYTKGGVPQTGGGNIGDGPTDDTLIAKR